MKIFLHSMLALLLPILLPPQHNTLIDWSAAYRLQWDDFKASPDKSSPNAALTSTAIKFDFSYNGRALDYHISCQFDKTQSWGRVKNDYILSHEQGHFDIAEIYARKLNKLLKEYTVTNVNRLSKEVNKLYENTMRQLHDMQVKYDAETNFSINTEKQNEWLKKISLELKELETYADYH